MAKATFRTCLSDTKDFVSESGSPYLNQYAYDFDEKGEVKRTTLHKTDKPLNVYERIQADYVSCDINAIMKRFALGDSEALNIREGIYADVTKMPKSYAELFQRLNDCQSYFEGLDPEVKELFSNSYEEFWSEYGTDEFNKKIESYNDQFVDHSFDVDVSEDIKEGDKVDE